MTGEMEPDPRSAYAQAKRGMVRSIIAVAFFTLLGAGLFIWADIAAKSDPYGNGTMVGGPGGTPLSFFLGIGVLIDAVPAGIALLYALLHANDYLSERRLIKALTRRPDSGAPIR